MSIIHFPRMSNDYFWSCKQSHKCVKNREHAWVQQYEVPLLNPLGSSTSECSICLWKHLCINFHYVPHQKNTNYLCVGVIFIMESYRRFLFSCNSQLHTHKIELIENFMDKTNFKYICFQVLMQDHQIFIYFTSYFFKILFSASLLQVLLKMVNVNVHSN